MGFLAWVARKIKFAFAGAALIGPFIAFIFAQDGMHVRDVLANGTETVAAIEGGKRSLSKRGGEGFVIDLAWTDAEGTQRRASGLRISNDFAHKIVTAPGVRIGDTFGIAQSPNWQLTRATVRIKYVASQPDSPVILEDAGTRARMDNELTWLGAVFAAIGLAGSGAFYFAGRRGRARATA